MKIHDIEIDSFTEEALEALFWSESQEDGSNYDEYSFTDLDIDSLKVFKERCEKFQEENKEALSVFPERNGHNFILSCNGHGAGFFDEHLSYSYLFKEGRKQEYFNMEETGRLLQEICRKEKEFNLYLGDDGKLYL